MCLSSPFKVKVLPTYDASKVTASGPGLSSYGVPASLPVEFAIDARDAGEGLLAVQITVTGSSFLGSHWLMITLVRGKNQDSNNQFLTWCQFMLDRFFPPESQCLCKRTNRLACEVWGYSSKYHVLLCLMCFALGYIYVCVFILKCFNLLIGLGRTKFCYTTQSTLKWVS